MCVTIAKVKNKIQIVCFFHHLKNKIDDYEHFLGVSKQWKEKKIKRFYFKQQMSVKFHS